MHQAAPGQVEPKRKTGLARLIQFFIELAQERGYAKVTVTVQKGQIEFVHVDRSYTLEALPIRDQGATEQPGRS